MILKLSFQTIAKRKLKSSDNEDTTDNDETASNQSTLFKSLLHGACLFNTLVMPF